MLSLVFMCFTGLFSLFLFNVYRYSAPSFHQFADFPSSGIAEGEESSRQLVWRSILLGLMTSLETFFFRPTVMILLIAVFGVLFSRRIGRSSF